MVSPDDDRILYDDQDDETAVFRPGRLVMGLAVLALVFGIVYLAEGSIRTGPVEPASALEAVEPLPEPTSGFDASSAELKACDGILEARPDFAIVVAGAVAADGHPDVSRVVQFVVVDKYNDYRYGRDVRALSLCTLP
jgi:hypothetical protein